MNLLNFEINAQRKVFLEAKGKIVLNACPGSGKTTAIAKKIILLEKEYETGHNKYSGIACLSYTNTAKDELNIKYSQIAGRTLRYPHHVSTIDSFINHFITLPFYNLLNRDFKRPKILDNTGILDTMWLTTYTGKDGKLKEGLLRPLNDFKAKDNRSIYHTYPPSSIRIEPDGKFSYNGVNPSKDTVDIEQFNKYCKHIKQKQFEKGLISTGDSAYIALYLLRKYKKIGEWLTNRFPHMIIDEAQDNSEIQHCIFEELEKQGLKNIEFVGDPFQSLYEWRDANPKLFLQKYNDSINWQGLDLTDNRRSPQRIIDAFSLIRASTDPKINSSCEMDKGLPIIIYRYSANNSSKLIKHYEKLCKENDLKDNQVVVRGNTFKNQILGVSRSIEPWKEEMPYGIIEAKHLYESKEMKNAITLLRKIVIPLIGPNLNYIEQRELENNLKSEHPFNSLLIEILHDLPKFNLSIAQWTTNTQIFLKEKLDTENEVDFSIKNRNSKYFNKSVLLEAVDLHFKKSSSENAILITTVHQVKGKSLDSILIFFNENKHKDTITFDDIISNNDSFPSEKQRIIYVAMSRPKHLLAMAFPSSVSEDDLKKKFGSNIKIVSDMEISEIQ